MEDKTADSEAPPVPTNPPNRRRRRGRGKRNKNSPEQSCILEPPRIVRYGEKRVIAALLLALEEGWIECLRPDESTSTTIDEKQPASSKRRKQGEKKGDDDGYNPSDLFSAIKYFFGEGETVMGDCCPSHPQNCEFLVAAWRLLTKKESDSSSNAPLVVAQEKLMQRHQLWKATHLTKHIIKSNRETTGLLNTLPAEIVEMFFTFLPLESVIQCTMVCYYWYAMISDNERLWRSVYENRLGKQKAERIAKVVGSWKTALREKVTGVRSTQNPRKVRSKPRTKPGSKKEREKNKARGRRDKYGF